MAVTRLGDNRNSISGQTGLRKDDTEKITIQGDEDEEQEIVVRHEAMPEKKASSVWSWYEEFAAEMYETLITKKEKRRPKQGKWKEYTQQTCRVIHGIIYSVALQLRI